MSVSVISRIWRRLINPTSCVGKDLEGNRYFEYPSPHGELARPKRVVKYKRGYDMWTYIAGEKRLPVQWTSWLTHTRAHPPPLEELIADLERQRRVLLNAALIEARDREANAAAQITQAPTRQSFPLSSVTENVQDFSQAESHPSDPSLTHKAGATTTVPSRGDQQPPKPPKSIPNTPQVSDETQSWAPRTIRRGG